MISTEYCQMMARYNMWQNKQLVEILDPMEFADLTKDRGAFFKSIFGTMNHILWGDGMWLSRLGHYAPPDVAGAESASFKKTYEDWKQARSATDETLISWASSLTSEDLAREMTWESKLSDMSLTRPVWVCVAHVFNHQTHHRGQVHAMLTGAGCQAPVSDIPFIPGAFD